MAEFNSSRPTDEEILNQQNAIKVEEASKIPFVADKEPLSALKAEYESGNKAFVSKIEGLETSYSGIRRTRGDGNCCFRGFLFGYLESVALMDHSQREAEVRRMKAQVERCKADLRKLGYAELTWEDFANIFSEQLDVSSLPDQGLRLSTLVQNLRDPEVSNYAVMFLRFVTSCAIQLQQEFFEPFISGTSGLTVEQFCHAMVEPMGEESDHIHITALTGALGVPVQVIYLDRSDGEASVHEFMPESPVQTGQESSIPKSNVPPVSLLYRPGHYDILYRRSQPE